MTVAIRAAQPGDIPALAAILTDWLQTTDWMPKLHTPAEDRDFIAHLLANQTVRVALAGGRVAGFLSRDGQDLTALYIARDFRRQGIGFALLDEAMALGSLSLWTFQANADARAFYRAKGFAEAEHTNGVRNQELLPDLRLVWSVEEDAQ